MFDQFIERRWGMSINAPKKSEIEDDENPNDFE